MSDPKDIPVCTLFKDDTDSGADGTIFTDSSQQEKHSDSRGSEQIIEEASVPEPVGQQEHKQSTNEPGVCDIFQTVPSTEDLFANLTISHVNDPEKDNKGLNVEDATPVSENFESENFEATVENAGKILKHEFLQGQNKTSNVVGDAALTKEKSDYNLDEAMGSESVNIPTTFNNSDLMTSILINDSLENLSNLSFDQNGRTDAASSKNTKTTETALPTDNIVLVPEESSLKVLGPNLTPRLDVVNAESLEESVVLKDQEIMPAEELPQTDASPFTDATEPQVASGLVSSEDQSKSVVLKDQVIMPVEELPQTNVSPFTDATQPLVASTLFSSEDQRNPFDQISQKSTIAVDDAFTNALQTSEIDRRRDAWIADEHTQTILSAVAQSQKRVQLEPKHLARPGLATSESLGDPVKALLARYKGISSTSQRKTLTLDSVSKDKQGLQQLVETGNYRTAVDLCGKVLTNFGQGFGSATQESSHSPDSLKWWHARFSLLLRLKLYDLAVTEFEHFQSFDSADLYYGFYPDLFPGRRGSMVPFSLRLLYADFLRHVNKPNEALSRLYAMQAISIKIINNLQSNKSEDGCLVELKPEDSEASLKLWKDRKVKIMFCIANTLLQLREYHSAVDVLDDIMSLSPSFAVPILSSVGRTLLQLGDIKAAQQRFAQAERVAGSTLSHKVQLSMNRAFLYLGANNWNEALNQFTEVLQLDPANIEALNNKAVCLLYLCRLKDAIAMQEEAVQLEKESDSAKLQKSLLSEEVALEGALSNLVTLYELESSKAITKKQALLQHVAARNGDGFNVACLKM